MATYLSIYIDFLKATSQARELENIADSMERCADKEFENSSRLRTMWKGSNATQFCGKMDTSAESIKAVSSRLRQSASTVREIATRTYNAEKTALDIARKRDY